jgi:ABC-2 type transport system ATP-binding protein
VEENIEFFGGVYGVTPEKLAEREEYVLKMAGLEDQRKMMTKLLAGGWKQRLALGCAILHEPPILFLDEPTSGVDPIARRSFWELIYQLSEAGNTIFVTTHYMDEAEYCHRIALMHGGQVIALGSPAELKASLGMGRLLNLETWDLLASMTTLEGKPGILDIAVFGGGLHLKVEDDAAAIAVIRGALDQAGIQIVKLEAITPSMEDVFVSLIEAREKAA